MKLAFFGTPTLTIPVLEELTQTGLKPSLIISAPDKPVGRKQIITSPAAIDWARKNHIKTWQPTTTNELTAINTPLTNSTWDMFVVFAYGMILPKSVFDLPKYKTLNLHPSLLPNLRGPSPVHTAILKNINPTGVTIMLLDEQMDHGPILSQMEHKTPLNSWPPTAEALESELIDVGAKLLTKTIIDWKQGNIIPKEQNHNKATYSSKIQKSDAEISLNPLNLPKGDLAYKNILKIKAYSTWPECFFIYQNKKVKIKDAKINKHEELVINRVLPEGKKEMNFSDYLKSISEKYH